jgi:hypothetical protein
VCYLRATWFLGVEGRFLKRRIESSYLPGFRGRETNEQVFYVLSLCFVGFLLLVVVRQTFLRILVLLHAF